MNYLNNIWLHKGEESRTISPENRNGEKGKAAMTASHLGIGRKGSPSVPINAGETITFTSFLDDSDRQNNRWEFRLT